MLLLIHVQVTRMMIPPDTIVNVETPLEQTNTIANSESVDLQHLNTKAIDRRIVL